MTSCHVCDTATDDACVRCERPTCSTHFWDQQHFAICQSCADELQALLDTGELQAWPYPVRRRPAEPGDVGA